MTVFYEGFTPLDVRVNGVRLRGRTGGDPDRPAVLLLHGHPETHLMWHRVAPRLAEDYFVVAPDLRGYGDSERPAATPDHSSYSKRVMARDCARLMTLLGHERFFGISFHHADAAQLPFPGRSFDRALMLEVASHLPDTARDGKQAAFAEAARCLKRGGLLALVDMVEPPVAPGAGTLMGEVPSVHLSTRNRLEELLAAVGFDVLDVTDISEHTRYSAQRNRAAFENRRQELAAAFGADTVRRIALLLGQLAEADASLGYVTVIARAG